MGKSNYIKMDLPLAYILHEDTDINFVIQT